MTKPYCTTRLKSSTLIVIVPKNLKPFLLSPCNQRNLRLKHFYNEQQTMNDEPAVPATSDLSFIVPKLRDGEWTTFGQPQNHLRVIVRWPVDDGRAFADVYIEKRPAEFYPPQAEHPTGRKETVSISVNLCLNFYLLRVPSWWNYFSEPFLSFTFSV